jgi:hypothetical protein
MSSVKLSLESLYKSLYIVGLFLLACGIAIGWKSFDLTLGAKQQFAKSEIELCKSRTDVSIRYHKVRDGFRKLEFQLERSGIPKDDMQTLTSEYLFPIASPNDDGTGQQSNLSRQAKSPKLQTPLNPIERWIERVSNIDRHRNKVEVGLASKADNLKTATYSIAKEQLERISVSLKELQESVKSLAASEQLHAAAMAVNNPEAHAQPTLTMIAFAFVVVGMTVVGRVTFRWCNDIFQKHGSESKDLEMTGDKFFGELFQFNRRSVVLSSLVGFAFLLVFLPLHFDSMSERLLFVPPDILDVPEQRTAPLYIGQIDISSKNDS